MTSRRGTYKNNKPLPSDVFSKKPERSEKKPPRKPTPIMIVNEIGRLWHQKLDAGVPEEFRQKSNRAIMRELSIRDGIYQLDLAESTHLKPPTVSVTLSKLEADGIVLRTVDPMDLRATKVYLTEKGHEKNAKLHECISNADKIALAGLSEEETETLLSLLERVRNNLAQDTDSEYQNKEIK